LDAVFAVLSCRPAQPAAIAAARINGTVNMVEPTVRNKTTSSGVSLCPFPSRSGERKNADRIATGDRAMVQQSRALRRPDAGLSSI
jgi:hypothetical protein